MDQLRRLIFEDVPTVRIDETFSNAAMTTDMFEHNPNKLSQLFQCGRTSFAHHENEFKGLFLPGA